MDSGGESGEEEERKIQMHVGGSRRKNASSAYHSKILRSCINASSLYVTDRRLFKPCSQGATFIRRTCWPMKVENCSL